jgi:hypothetical protein
MSAPTPCARLLALALLRPGLARARPAPEPGAAPPGAVPLHDCNANGVEDAVDIALGTSCDSDLDGIPDECQGGRSPSRELSHPRRAGGTPGQDRGS